VSGWPFCTLGHFGAAHHRRQASRSQCAAASTSTKYGTHATHTCAVQHTAPVRHVAFEPAHSCTHAQTRLFVINRSQRTQQQTAAKKRGAPHTHAMYDVTVREAVMFEGTRRTAVCVLRHKVSVHGIEAGQGAKQQQHAFLLHASEQAPCTQLTLLIITVTAAWHKDNGRTQMDNERRMIWSATTALLQRGAQQLAYTGVDPS
jgi:aromatic ring-cleaving dioxygenase